MLPCQRQKGWLLKMLNISLFSLKNQTPVVQRLDCAITQINHGSLDESCQNVLGPIPCTTWVSNLLSILLKVQALGRRLNLLTSHTLERKELDVGVLIAIFDLICLPQRQLCKCWCKSDAWWAPRSIEFYQPCYRGISTKSILKKQII